MKGKGFMKKTMLMGMALALVPASLFAVDGVVLINQSAVTAAGGFPYTISQSGSYKLSGDLIAPLNTNAINITASFVSLDLNGFNISCSSSSMAVPVNCITDTAAITNLTISNGTVRTTQPIGLDTPTISAINIGSPYTTVRDMSIFTPASNGPGVTLGIFSAVRRNMVAGIVTVGDLSLVAENVSTANINAGGAALLVNNIDQ